ncbi:MAG: hypothetical protein K2Y18_06080 [Alphaproteobacteria bacterium]|jgi:hypothetical protein|nr:hypothetical protein [Alphaproteobacteria bacterium]
MQFNGSFSVSSLVLLGLLSLQAQSKDAPPPPPTTTAPITTPSSTTPPGPSLFGMTKKPEGVDAAQKMKEEPVKPVETKSTWIPDDRKAGTITIKPLTVNLTALTFGMSSKHQKLNGFPIDAYRCPFGFMANRTERNGAGYDLELGVMATKEIELFTILSFSHETGTDKVNVMNAPYFAPLPGIIVTNMAYDFDSRNNYEISLGSRYYWNTQKPWFPFVGIFGTATFQGSVRAKVYNVIPGGFLNEYAPLGRFTLQSRKTLWGGTFQFGADYQFNKWVSLTLCAGLRYTPRPGITLTTINNTPISFRDNQSIWSLPVLVALKITL